MKMTILDNDKVIYTTTNTKEITSNLMYVLYAKAVNKVKWLTVKCNYNYTDIQKVRVIDKSDALNKRECVFEGIPTNWGALDTYKMLQDLEVKGE